MVKLKSNIREVLSFTFSILTEKRRFPIGILRHSLAIVIAGLSIHVISCATSPSLIDQEGVSQIDGVTVYTSDAPPDNYTLVDIVTVENSNDRKRYLIASKEAKKRGGEALIAKPEKRETVSEISQLVDMRRLSGFVVKRKSRSVVTQDFLIVSNVRQLSRETAFNEPVESAPEIPERSDQEKVQPSPSKEISAGEFRDNGDGSVLQIGTKLLWQKCSAGQNFAGSVCSGEASSLDAEEAEDYCDNLNLSNKTWRLPTREELEFLIDKSSVDKEGSETVIFKDIFPANPADIYWTTSPYYGSGGIARYVIDFSNGTSFAYYSEKKAYTRCVTIPTE